MSEADIVRFVERDWSAIERAKTQHWLRRHQTMSPAELWQLGYDIWHHAHILRPEGWPLSERLANVEVHRRVSEALRAAGRSSR